MAKNVLKDIAKEEIKRVDRDIVLNKTAEYFNLSLLELKSKKRTKNLVLPKQIAAYLLREITSLSLPEIGGFLGAKHHTTILYSYRKIKEQIKKDSGLKNTIDAIKQVIKNS